MKVYINHKNLEHFMTIKQLNRRQTCRTKFLSEFNFKISYRPGEQGEKSDILTHQSQNLLKDIKDSQQQYQFQTLLQDHQLDKDIKKVLVVTFCVNTINKDVDETVDTNEENEKIIKVEEFSDKFSDHSFSIPLQQIIPKSFGDKEGETDKTKRKLLKELFNKTYKDKVMKEIMIANTRGLRKLPIVLTKKSIILLIGDLKIENEQLYMKNRMYISENEALQLHLLQQYHNLLTHGHSGYKALYQKIQANYFRFDMAKHCK